MCETLRKNRAISLSPKDQPTLDAIALLCVVGDLSRTLVLYGQPGFAATPQDVEFAIVTHGGLARHVSASSEPPHCRPTVLDRYDQSPGVKPAVSASSDHSISSGGRVLGMKAFFLCDPLRKLNLFTEGIAEEETSVEQRV